MTSHDSEAPAHGRQVITAVALLVDRSSSPIRILVAQRSRTKKFLPGVFELPGGHVEFGESLHTALIRELWEEFGVGIRVGDPIGAFTYSNYVRGSHSVEVAFLAELTDAMSEISVDPKEHECVRWISEHDVAGIISDELGENDPEQYILKRAFSLLGGSRVMTAVDEEVVQFYNL